MLARETRVTLMSVEGAVRDSLEHMAGELSLADRAAIKLAEVYARDIDARGTLLETVGELKRSLLALEDQPEVHGQVYQLGVAVDRLTRQLAEGKILADVGPKLLAVLESLGATPAARAKITGARPAGPIVPPAANGQTPGQTPGQPAPTVSPRAAALARLRQVDGGATVIALTDLGEDDE